MALLARWMPPQRKIAIDLGTAFFRVASSDLGLVTIPTGEALNPPLRYGVVADPYAVACLLRPVLNKTKRLSVAPRVAVGIPTDANFKERKALHVAMCAAGAEDFQLVPEPQAAAFGAGIEINSPYAQMVVDIGEGVTDCAVIRSGNILCSRAVRIGCGTFRESVQAGYRQRLGIDLTHLEAEQLLEETGVGNSTYAISTDSAQHSVDRNADKHGISSTTIHDLVEPCLAEILANIDEQLRELPHEIGCEIIESGIILTGGGALLPGVKERLHVATAIDVTTPNDPLATVARGMLRMLEIGAVKRL